MPLTSHKPSLTTHLTIKDMRLSILASLMFALSATQGVKGGPIAYGICQTGCNALAVSCYAAAGVTFGTVVAAPATPLVILGCNTGLGTCSAACATVALFAPTP